jgi:hypothetical protein
MCDTDNGLAGQACQTFPIRSVLYEMIKVENQLHGVGEHCSFIRKFVLCPECDNPETDLIVSTKRNTISQGCKACGYHGQLEFNHKLNTFILKNPPAADPSVQVCTTHAHKYIAPI